MTLRELKEKRGAILKQMDGIAEAGAGKLTADQLKQYNDLKAEAEELRANIEILEDAAARAASGSAPVSSAVSEGEKKDFGKFSIVRAMGLLQKNRQLDGIEAEVHQEAEREARSLGISLDGVGIPSRFIHLGKRDLTVGTATAGGNTVATDLGGLIPFLNPKPVVMGLGADVMSGLVGNLDLPRHSTQAAASWYAENAQASEADDAFNKISLTPKRLARVTEISKQLLAQSSIGIESFVRKSLETSIALALDTAAINGSGSSNQPTGILNTSGIGDVAGGTNGAVPTWAHILELEGDVDTANALMGNLHYLTTPGIKAKLKGTLKSSGVSGYIWSEGDELNGYNAVGSNLVPSTLTKGSASAICHAIIFGNWSELIIGQWAGVDITIDPYTKADSALVRMIVNSWWDIAVKHPASFSAMKDALVA